ncbi:MAG: hypothetical protein OXH92_12785, partial [Bryobacterales bacterium]|nr:hypothetical protein [Bryobacterales bacterium]
DGPLTHFASPRGEKCRLENEQLQDSSCRLLAGTRNSPGNHSRFFAHRSLLKLACQVLHHLAPLGERLEPLTGRFQLVLGEVTSAISAYSRGEIEASPEVGHNCRSGGGSASEKRLVVNGITVQC